MEKSDSTVKLLVPTALRDYAEGRKEVEVKGETARQALEELTRRYTSLARHLFDEEGNLRYFVNVYLNQEDIRHLQGLETKVEDGDTLMIVPSIAGGAIGVSEPSVELTPMEIRRYGRHLIMPEVGMDGQKKLKASSVLVIGAGGLGSPVTIYLAAAGVGRIGIVDHDEVDHSNLQRQILYSSTDVGRPKTEAARERLRALNPEVDVQVHEESLTSENALDIIREYDVVVDGTDNYPTRYLVNDACVLLKKPNVYGSIFRFEGQTSVFDAADGPCYRCLYPEPPPPGLVPSCAEGGVLGVLPGIIGLLQATETVKIILGEGRPLTGRLLLFDALRMSFEELTLRKDPDCPICGPSPTITELIDYDQFCGVGELTHYESGWETSPKELAQKLQSDGNPVLLDVRTPTEHAICTLLGARLIPMNQLLDRLGELNTADEIVAYCHTGGRSAMAVRLLRQMGFVKAVNLAGGIDAWAEKVDLGMPRY
ncbi:MAG: ubiquitin-like small modifier protein 1 [Candidatus Geothermarchaeales archaeon]